jgi:hypothetical protein
MIGILRRMKGTSMRHALLALGVLLLVPAIASALPMADITFDYTSPAANTYVFDFTVHNLAGPAVLDYFQIEFDADADWQSYDNIFWVDDRGWTSDAYGFGAGFGGLPAVANADSSSLYGSGTPISIGDKQGGFRVSFMYAGALPPADQLFSFYATFGTNDQGSGIPILGPTGAPDYWIEGVEFGQIRYVPSGPPGWVPEPATGLLVGLGLCGLVVLRRRSRRG